MSGADDALAAAVDLIGRTGATDLEVGFLHDDVPSAEAGWWAAARYRGARVTVEDKASPAAAVDGLLVRLLDGGRCRWCGRAVTNRKSASARRFCRYRLDGRRYVRGCTTTDPTVPVPAWARGGTDG